jgi:hypothetical protein
VIHTAGPRLLFLEIGELDTGLSDLFVPEMQKITIEISDHLAQILRREGSKSASSLEEELVRWLAFHCALRERLAKHPHWKLALADHHDRVVRELDLP